MYCKVNLPAVTPLASLKLMGMPNVRLLGKLIAWMLSGPRAKLGMPATAAGGAPTTKVVTKLLPGPLPPSSKPPRVSLKAVTALRKVTVYVPAARIPVSRAA